MDPVTSLSTSPKLAHPEIPSVLRVALSYEGMAEYGGDNRGKESVERFMRHTKNLPPIPWCASFVAFCGYYGCLDPVTRKSTWPLLRTASCWHLGEDARKRGVLSSTCQPGCVFLMYFPSKKRFAHTGFVIGQLPSGKWLTVEGNTNDDGSREGYEVAVRERAFGANDRFIAWWTL